ncbi:hypothetical protein [Dokdonia pacifica]|uniref:hypothetical protein n=1 Tax=Dokdonia pacifica TaxID=1627892 RepID=UPI001177EFFE|nr:hypothetical protein [Dokdonia pacifica]
MLITLCVLGITSCEADDLDSNEINIELYETNYQIDDQEDQEKPEQDCEKELQPKRTGDQADDHGNAEDGDDK